MTTEAKFISGPILSHILVMSITGAIGLSTIFLVDLLDIYFLSLLQQEAITAAIGFAGSILFFTVSICIGLSIATTAVIGRAIGAQAFLLAKQQLINSLVIALILSTVIALMVYMSIPVLVSLLGAEGLAHEKAVSYLQIMVPSMPILAAGMVFGSSLRAMGAAKLSMLTTLFGAAVNAVLDPLFIFTFDMGIEGAAYASVIARAAILVSGVWAVVYRHHFLTSFNLDCFKKHYKQILHIAAPAIMTNIATPIGGAYITYTVAAYGNGYVAGYSVIGRLMPVAFGFIYALSGAIGPIVAQNFGAKHFSRITAVLANALCVSTAYVLLISLALYCLSEQLVSLFQLSGDARTLLVIFCSGFAVFFLFDGALFISNAIFNNLHRPHYSMFFNIGKGTIGTMPFVYYGSQYGGIIGIWIGISIGAMIFGICAALSSRKFIYHLTQTAS